MRDFFREIRRYLTPCNLVLVGLTAVMYAVQRIVDIKSGADAFTEQFALAWWRIFENHEYYRLVTHIFLHGDLMHLLGNMLVLVYCGSILERILGGFWYISNYLCCGIVAGLASALWNARGIGGEVIYSYSIGASGAIFAMAGLLLFIVIANHGRVAEISTRQMIGFIVLSVYSGVSETGIDNIAHIAGAIFGFISGFFIYRRGGSTYED